jgi:cell division protein FtsI (penicillin-binding protein 3)
MSAARSPTWRVGATLACFALVAVALCWRSVDLQVLRNAAYQDLGREAHLRTVVIPAHRGMITDRDGEPLAISTPVQSIWVNPKELLAEEESQANIARLASTLHVGEKELRSDILARSGKEFVFLKRRVSPSLSESVKALKIPGVGFQTEFRRFYPTGEVSAQLIGFTGVDDKGLEGLELKHDDSLRGVDGSKRVLLNRRRDVIRDVERINDVREGRDLALSIDRRVQYLAYRELKAAVQRHDAVGGAMVVLDVSSGEVLAMVNQPSYNPNEPPKRRRGQTRNRAVTDIFEPGSTVKPFTVAAALESGVASPNRIIDTAPGYMFVGRRRIQDVHNYGAVDLTKILQKSSNVAVAKLALEMDKRLIWEKFSGLGFGSSLHVGFPGEQSGILNHYSRWYPIDQASVAFGYGVAGTALQLARAYLVLADDGNLKPVSLQRVATPPPTVAVFRSDTIQRVRKMMEAVVGDEGTAAGARIPGYRVAGKTGTVRKHTAAGYSDDRHISLFAGIVPASRPRLVAVVVIDEPKKGDYYGGLVAGPVFSSVMGGALRLLDVPPDDLVSRDVHLAAVGKTTRTQ